MKFLIVLVAAVGMVYASPQGFLQNTPEVQAATINFINEYNRLAKLAADAPDIHIYDDKHLQRVDLQPVHHHQPHLHPQQPAPLQRFDTFSYSTNIGANSHFAPTQITRSFQPAPQVHQPVVSHRFQTHQPLHFASVQQQAPVLRWTGALAHTVPAGVHGLPMQVGYTPEVQAARNEHFRILNQAHQASARTRSQG